ncbi:hypothetical protein HDU86_003852 [Geranomyces michiganensis]|nr:hypothetical protein HDU86_003852 [Geranomyces michiganensis]
MRGFGLLVVFALAAVNSAVAAPARALATCPTYTVRGGDFCFGIAQSQHISVDDLKRYNPGLNCDTIQPGAVLCVGAGSPPAPPTPPSGVCKVAVVKSGDSCSAIATANQVTLAQLLQFNKGINCNTIQPGDRLCVSAGTLPVPVPDPTPSGGVCKVAVVKSGDSCSLIATNNKITLAQLLQYNKGINCNVIQPGDRLCVSAGTLPVPVPDPTPPGGVCKVAVVKSGDSCSLIATNNQITLAQLLQYNKGINCNIIQPGDRLCVSAGTLPVPVPDPTPPGGVCKVAVVKSGDSCTLIATNNKITLAQLLQYNKGINCNIIQPGDRLCVSAGTLPTPTPEPTPPGGLCKPYTVKEGDTCYVIASTNGLSLAQLAAYNPTTDCGLIQPGQQMCLSAGKLPPAPTPTTDPTPPGGECKTVTVKEGDSCYVIAAANGLSLAQLAAFNPTTDCGLIQPGQLLCISAGKLPSTPTTPTQTPDTPTTPAACPAYLGLDGSGCYYDADSCKTFDASKLRCNADGTVPASFAVKCYSVKAEDGAATCDALAALGGLTVAQLVEYNQGLVCPKTLQTGAAVCISAPAVQ